MKNFPASCRILILALISSMSAMFLGCGPSASVSDEFARIAAQEVSNMSANSSSMIGAQGLGKTLAVAADTVYFDWNVYPYAWDAGVGGYVRTATITGSDGYERVRIDTLIFKDANGGTLRAPTFATCKTISHVRTVTHSKGGSELNIRVVMTSAISLTPDTTHVKNGTIIGTYDGEQVGTGTITSVTRAYTGGHWQFPRSGNIAVDFPRRTYNVDFLGSGNAKLTITNKATDKTTIVNYHVDEK